MEEIKLSYPQKQDTTFSSKLFELYDKAKKTTADVIVFDLSRTESLTPLGIIMLTATIKECQNKGKKCRYIKPKKRSTADFFRDIGFNKFFNLSDSDYHDIDNIHTGTLQLKRLQGINTDFAETVTEIIKHHLDISPGLQGYIRMSMIEAITNAVDHSGVSDYYVCCWMKKKNGKNVIHLCIADLGMGIKQSLMKMEQYKTIRTDHEAIKLATEDSVSSREGKAGLGLMHIKRFIKLNKGRLCIISCRGKVYWKYDRGHILEQKMQVPFHGTIIKMIINADKEENFYFLANETEYIF
jgi:anti-sigma regulatory factor (Ser/Thr protein kinase)/anti-anti-sigma regulatory factor